MRAARIHCWALPFFLLIRPQLQMESRTRITWPSPSRLVFHEDLAILSPARPAGVEFVSSAASNRRTRRASSPALASLCVALCVCVIHHTHSHRRTRQRTDGYWSDPSFSSRTLAQKPEQSHRCLAEREH